MGRLSRQETEARREKLRELLATRTYLPVGELVAQLGVSEATARRDLASLAGRQLLHRTRGGAIRPYSKGLGEFEALFPAVEQRRGVNPAGKHAIATEAARHIKPGETLFLDAGSTCMALAEILGQRSFSKPITVVTINVAAALTLGQADAIRVELLGGRVLGRQAVVVDERGASALSKFTFHSAFISGEGFDGEGVWNSQAAVVALQRAAVRRATRAVALLDHTKLSLAGPVRLCPWRELDLLITDASREALASAGVSPRRNELDILNVSLKN